MGKHKDKVGQSDRKGNGSYKLVMSLLRDGGGVEPALSNHGFSDYCLNRQLPEIVPWGKRKRRNSFMLIACKNM